MELVWLLWADIWIIVVTILNKIVLANLFPVFEIGPWYAETPDWEVTESIPIKDINWCESLNLVISPTSDKNKAELNSPKPVIELIYMHYYLVYWQAYLFY